MWDKQKNKYTGRLGKKWFHADFEFTKDEGIGSSGVAGCIAYGKALSKEGIDRRKELLHSLGFDESAWEDNQKLQNAFTALAKRHVPGYGFVGFTEEEPRPANRIKDWDEKALALLGGLVLQRVTKNVSENAAAISLEKVELGDKLPAVKGATYARKFRDAMSSVFVKARIVQMQEIYGLDWAEKMIRDEITWDMPRVSLFSLFSLAEKLVRKGRI